MLYVSQIIILYTLNLYNAICQFYLNKTGRKNKIYFKKRILFSHIWFDTPHTFGLTCLLDIQVEMSGGQLVVQDWSLG